MAATGATYDPQSALHPHFRLRVLSSTRKGAMMQAFWLKFTDGSEGCCEGTYGADAVRIAEHLTGKTVAVEAEHRYKPEQGEAVKILPYPTGNMIWQFEHPVYGKTPGFCYRGAQCRGRTACPGNPSCTS